MTVATYGRMVRAEKNEMTRCLGALVGIAQGLICDDQLNDQEIRFLDSWLNANHAISFTWPGDVIHARVREILADGKVTDAERIYLIDTLKELIGRADPLDAATHVTEIAFDSVSSVEFAANHFCLTGDFVYGPRDACIDAIERRGGVVTSVTKKLRYLVVGTRGSAEWKHGSFGTKFEKAMQYKMTGCQIAIIKEGQWAACL